MRGGRSAPHLSRQFAADPLAPQLVSWARRASSEPLLSTITSARAARAASRAGQTCAPRWRRDRGRVERSTAPRHLRWAVHHPDLIDQRVPFASTSKAASITMPGRRRQPCPRDAVGNGSANERMRDGVRRANFSASANTIAPQALDGRWTVAPPRTSELRHHLLPPACRVRRFRGRHGRRRSPTPELTQDASGDTLARADPAVRPTTSRRAPGRPVEARRAERPQWAATRLNAGARGSEPGATHLGNRPRRYV